jgi:hypothetical protein
VAELVDQLRAVLRAEWPDAPAGAHRRVVARLCERLGGERYYVPRRPPGEAAAKLAAAIAGGASLDAAARAAGVSLRHARRLRGTGS